MKFLLVFRCCGVLLAGCASLLGAWCVDAYAAEAFVKTNNVAAKLVAEHSVVQPGQRLAVMLHQTIRSGWHTYWVNPGDSGQPTQIKWQLPAGVTAEPIQWPTPQPIKVGPLVNYGYSESVGLISTVTVPAQWPVGTPFTLAADANWLVCEEECIPESGHFTLVIPTALSSEVATAEQSLFATVRASQPVAASFVTNLSTHDDQVVLQMALPEAVASHIVAAHFFPAQWGVINHAAPQTLTSSAAGLRIATHKGELPTPAQFTGIVALTEQRGEQLLHTSFLVSGKATPVVSDATAMSVSIIVVLLSALAGGLLLNLMPCVFPFWR